MEDAQTDLSARHPLPDLIRIWALMGIVLVNVSVFAWPAETGYFSGALSRPIDLAASGIITLLFTTKSYALFSLMFGASLAFQIASAERYGVSGSARHLRRMAGLFVLGLVHASLFYIGDILIAYAILGTLLYAFRNQSIKALVIAAACAFALQLLILLAAAGIFYTVEAGLAAEDLAEFRSALDTNTQAQITTFGEGSFSAAAHYRASQLSLLIFSNTLFQGAGIFAYFLIGLALARTGLMGQPSAPFWKTCRQIFLPIGLAGSLLATLLFHQASSFVSAAGLFSLALLTLFAPFSALGYTGWIAKYAAGPASRLKAFLMRAGGATLTAYLLQSIILSFVFSAYGLGLYAKVAAAPAIAIGLATGLVTLATTSLWRARFPRGPFEALLRTWTYLGAR